MDCKPSEPCYRFDGKLKSMSPRMAAPASAIPSVIMTGGQRRTVGEALERLTRIQPAPLTGLPYGVQRILRKPMMVYTAAWFLASAFVIVDPLDRLEGGLID